MNDKTSDGKRIASVTQETAETPDYAAFTASEMREFLSSMRSDRKRDIIIKSESGMALVSLEKTYEALKPNAREVLAFDARWNTIRHAFRYGPFLIVYDHVLGYTKFKLGRSTR